MRYYKAKNYIDDNTVHGGVVIERELFTTHEMMKYNLMKHISNFTVINIKLKNTYFCFGARFEMEGENND